MATYKSIHTCTKFLGLREWMLGGKPGRAGSMSQVTEDVHKTQVNPVTQEEIKHYLKCLAESVASPEAVEWTEVCFKDIKVKSKVLLACEAMFHRPVPNNSLGTIDTFGDLLKFYYTPPQPPPGALFTNIRENLSSLPPNLSIEFPPKQRPEPERKPFQNFNDPRHKTFPNKKEKHHRY